MFIYIPHTGAVEEDSLRIMLYDANLLMGNEDLDYLTPDPLVGIAEIPLAGMSKKNLCICKKNATYPQKSPIYLEYCRCIHQRALYISVEEPRVSAKTYSCARLDLFTCDVKSATTIKSVYL